MAIATFGKKVFEVSSKRICTPDDIQYGSAYETEVQDSAGRKPSTYRKGPGLNTMSFRLRLEAALGVNPAKEMEEWERIKDTGAASYFILGGKPYGKCKWQLKNISVGSQIINNGGQILSAEMTLEFQEYVREGTAKAKTSGGATPGVNVVDQLLEPQMNKADLKRENPNMPPYVAGMGR